MANTYTQLNIHAVFAVTGRQNLLHSGFRHELFKYITGILRSLKQFPLAVNGFTDHVHIFFELHPDSKLSDVMREVKASSSKWINDNKFVIGKFQWQAGYGAFSYHKSVRDRVIKYIINQEDHHKSKTFREEYLGILQKFNIEYDQKYLFEFYD